MCRVSDCKVNSVSLAVYLPLIIYNYDSNPSWFQLNFIENCTRNSEKKNIYNKIYTNCVITSCNEELSHVSLPQITALFSQESCGSLLEICGSVDVSYHSISR